MKPIRICLSEDGGNPRSADHLNCIDNNTWLISPFSEDQDPNYKFRLDFIGCNQSTKSSSIGLIIDWHDKQFIKYRKQIYFKHENDHDWAHVALSNIEAKSHCRLPLKPGTTRISLLPAYNLQDFQSFIANLPHNHPRLQIAPFGLSMEGRKLWQIILGDMNHTSKHTMLIACRLHPYETAGSFCAEGMVDYYLTALKQTGFALDPFRIHLVPMANPDGVYNGLCKKTSIRGIDLSKIVNRLDPTCKSLVDLIDSLKPSIYCEIHNWMLPIDSVFYTSVLKSLRLFHTINRKIRPAMDKLHLSVGHLIRSPKPNGLKKYAQQNHGAIPILFEFNWYQRNTDNMRSIGAAVLHGLARHFNH